MQAETGSMIIGVIQAGFAVALLPTLFDRYAQVPRWSSGLTAAGLWGICAVYALLGLGWAAVAAAASAALWTLIWWLRPVPPTAWKTTWGN